MSHFHAVVWLDHAEARVFQFNADNVESRVIHAQADPHGVAHGSPRVHHKAGVIGSGKVHDEPAFFGQVAAALEGAEEFLVLGPGQAKLEFNSFVDAHIPSIGRRIVAIETVDKMTDNQIVAHAREYFARTDRTRPQLGGRGA